MGSEIGMQCADCELGSGAEKGFVNVMRLWVAVNEYRVRLKYLMKKVGQDALMGMAHCK